MTSSLTIVRALYRIHTKNTAQLALIVYYQLAGSADLCQPYKWQKSWDSTDVLYQACVLRTCKVRRLSKTLPQRHLITLWQMQRSCRQAVIWTQDLMNDVTSYNATRYNNELQKSEITRRGCNAETARGMNSWTHIFQLQKCDIRGRGATESRGSIDPHFFSYPVHKRRLNPHFLSRSIAVHTLLEAQTGCQTSVCGVRTNGAIRLPFWRPLFCTYRFVLVDSIVRGIMDYTFSFLWDTTHACSLLSSKFVLFSL